MIDKPDYLPLTCYQGRTFQLTFTITQSNGSPFSLANVTEIKFQASIEKNGDAVVSGSITSGMFAIQAPAAGGIFTMTISDEATALFDFDALEYDIKFEYADGTADTWYYGPFELVRSVTP